MTVRMRRHELAAGLCLGAKAPFRQSTRRAERLLGPIIRRLHPLLGQKGPEGGGQTAQIVAEGGRGFVRLGPVL